MPERPLAPGLRPFDAVGGWTIAVVDSLGRFGSFFAEALAVLVTPPFKIRAFVDRIHFVGYNSLLIIFLTGAFTGMVLGLQIYLTLVRFGSEAFLGPAVALSLIRRGKFKTECRVFFADAETAWAAGYRPCGACLRDEYKVWKAGTL